jgi:hypothetical protein
VSVNADLTSRDMLTAARHLVDRPTETTRGLWPRAAALLGRQALELAVNDLWLNLEPGVEMVSARAQFLCLPSYVEPSLARRVSQTWWSLTRATHHHAYDLAPTADELSTWLEDVNELLEVLTPK